MVVPAGAAAAGTPNIGLELEAPAQALIGTKQKAQLVATNPAGQKRGYNLSFRVVLPKGVSYVPGSASSAPRVVEGRPGVGMTTLLFENVGDLSAFSEYALTYEVEPSTSFFKFTEEGKYPTYVGKAEAFVDEKPRKKPSFDEFGAVVPGSYSGSAQSEAKTELTAIEIVKSEPSPEGEILRGVHEHQTVYTLKVRNNKVGPTQGVTGAGPKGETGIVIEDWLPAGLEFLGCGKVDNTTDAGTNPGSAEEYPGSGAIDPGNAPAAPSCVEPFSVETEEVDPPGPQPKGVYTHVKFLGPASLSTGQEIELQYVAAIPIRANALTWNGAGGKPSATSLGQIANLDNNNGPETFDEEQLTNVAQARGVYESVPVRDTDELTRTAEDLAIQKGTSPSQPSIFAGAETNWTLRLEASEYRRTEPVSITDQLPNGLCPRGPENYEGPVGGPIVEPKEECEASATLHPSVTYLKGGAEPAGTEEAIEYTLAEEEATGGFKIEFNGPDVAALARLEPSQELLVSLPTTTRVFYQSNYKDARPVLTGDSWTNAVSAAGTAFSRCFVEPATPDPNCEGTGAKKIVAEGEGGTSVSDVSSAGQQAGGVEIEKTVRENDFAKAIPTECEGPDSEYVKGIVSKEEPILPQYRPGDQVCWRLVVRFASNLYAGTPVVSDFIPGGQKYVPGSAVEGPDNTAEATFNEEAAEEKEALEWTIGKSGAESVESKLVFEWRFRTQIETSEKTAPDEITGNLMKFFYSNSEGETFPLRDRAEVQRAEPDVSLEKWITEVSGKSIPRPPPGGKSTAVAGGGQRVSYELDLENAGNLEAEEAEVWDVLPAGIECSDVTIPTQTAPQAAACTEGVIKWTGVAVPEGGKTALTYEITVPDDVAPGHVFVNHTGVRSYKSRTNTPAEKYEYVPAKNIDESIKEEETNTGPLLDEAELTTGGATLEKSATSEVTQPGNGAKEATIGEVIDYQVTARIPGNSKIYGAPVIKDTLPTNVQLIAGSIAAKLDGVALPTQGLTLETLTNGFEVKFNGAYPPTPSPSEHVVVVTLKARVLNIAANERGKTITNKATFKYEDIEEAGSRTLTKSASTPVVEPNIEVRKKNLLPEGRTTVSPGEVVQYETEVEDKAGASTANEVTVVDTAPPGTRIVGSQTPAGTVSGNTITWHLGAIAPGSTQALRYELEIEEPAKAASSFTNRVVATTQSLPEGEGGEPSQIRTAAFGQSGYESKAADTVKLIGATVSKEVTPTEGTIGKELTYTLHMNLPPEIKYFNTTMVDRLPNGVTFDELVSTRCEFEGGESCGTGEAIGPEAQPDGTTLLGWYFGFFEAGKARELTVQFKAHIDDVKAGGGAEVKAPETLTNQLVGLYNETEGTKPTTVPVPGSNGFGEETAKAEATTKVVEPSVTLAKSVVAEPALAGGVAAQPGSKLTYSLTVGNTGTSTAFEVEVEDTNTTGNLRSITPVAGAEFVKSAPGAPLVWVLPKVEAGKTVTLTYTAELPPSGELEDKEEVDNAAAVPSYFGLEKSEREAAKTFRAYEGPEASKDLEVALPKIGVVKTTGVEGFPDEASAEVGRAFPWRVVVTNESTLAGAKAVTVEDVLPPHWDYVSGSSEFKAVAGAVVPVAKVEPTKSGTEIKTLTWTSIAELPPGASVEVLFDASPTVAAIANAGGAKQANKAVGSFQDLSGASGSEAGPYSAEDEAFAELLSPELAIEKTPDGGETVAGTNDEYEITVSNSGTGTAHEVEVKDVLSAGQEFVGPATAEPSTGFAQKSVEANTPGTGETTIVWTIAEVANGTPVKIKVPIKTPPSAEDGDEVTDLATVRSPQQSKEPSDPGSFVIERETNLRILKKAVEPSVNAGEEIHYEVEVENEGPSDATGIVVTDQLPANTIFKAADPECAEAGEVVTCELAELKLAEKHVFKFTVEVESGTTETIKNTADVEDDQGGTGESTAETPIGGLANLKIEKVGPDKPVLLGSQFTYEIQVENEGPSDAVGATVEDALKQQVKFLSATTTAGTCDEAPAALLTCELGRMLPHARATIVVTVEAAEVGTFTNTATFDSTSSPEPKEGEAPPTVILPAADLAITKTGPTTVAADGEVTYGLHVENLGPSIAHQVVVTDPLPKGVDFVKASEGCAAAAGVVTCAVQPADELEVGGSADFQITVHVPFALGGQALVNTATVAAEEADPHIENNSSTVTTTVGPAADLAIAKTMGKAQAGQPLVYTLAITNKGPSASSAVTVKDTLPAGTTFRSAAPSQGTCSASGQAVTCGLGALTSGGSAQVSITVEVAATATGPLKNTATVEGPEPDPDKSNNEASVEGPVSPPVPTDPNLKVVKTVDTSSPRVGSPFAYDVEVTNMSGGEAKNVKVVDTLNGPVKVVSIEADAGKCGAQGSTITCTIPSIPVGKTVHITYSVIAEAAGPLKNTVSAQAANGEKVPGNNRAVKSVQAKLATGTFKLIKTASRKVVPGGKKVGFTITLRNGAAALTDAKICDRLPAALVFVKAAGARFVNGEACWTEPFVAAHRTVRFHLTARAVKGYVSRRARNVATAQAANASSRSAAATVRVEPAFAGKPGGVTG